MSINNRNRGKTLKFMSLIMCLLVLAGCGTADTADTGATGSESTDEITDAETEAAATTINLVLNGETRYKVIRPSMMDVEAPTVLQAVAIRAAINQYVSTGTAGIGDDYDKYPDDSYMIYVGTVDNDEGDRLSSEVGYGEYSISVKGNSIYVYGSDDTAIEKAGERFISLISQYVSDNADGTKSLIVPIEVMNDGKHSIGNTILPSVEGSTYVNSYSDVYYRNYIFTENVNSDEFKAYETKLLDNGFTRFYKKQTQNVVKEYYYNSEIQLELSYNASADHLNMISQLREDKGDFPTFYALCVSESVNVYKTADTSSVALTKAKYDVMTAVSTNDSEFYEVSGEGDGKYVASSDVEIFMSLAGVKTQAAIVWGRDIAADNEFHYGYATWSHHYGCYFCGTNSLTGTKCRNGAAYEDQLKTYCCNPFVTACYCHGAGAITLGAKLSSIVNCRGLNIDLANDYSEPLENRKYFMQVEKPDNMCDLVPGDILLSPNHAMLYTYGNYILEASGGDDNVKNSEKWNNSIHEASGSSKYSRVTKVYRYIGK